MSQLKSKKLFLIDVSEFLVKKSALAKVNDKLWDMNRPLESDCTVSFLNFKDSKPYHANLVYFFCFFLNEENFLF